MYSRPLVRFACLTLLCLFAASTADAAQLYVGATSTDITPKLPVSLTGQMRTRIAKTVESPVTANVLVLESRDGDKSLEHVVFVSCDLVCIRGGIHEKVREKLKDQLPGLSLQKVIMNATHTHTAPTMIEGRYTLPKTGVTQPAEFVEFAAQKIADAIQKAWNERQPGQVGWGLGHAVIAQNRRALYEGGWAKMYGSTSAKDFRGIEGYEDHTMEVLCFWNDKDELIATAVNIACPAQAVEGRSTVNADFWHPVREALKKKYGDQLTVLGWAGAAGDQVPRPMYRKAAEARMMQLRNLTLLEELSRRIVAGWEEAYAGAVQEKHADALLKHEVRTIELPLQTVSEADHERISKEIKAYADDPSKVWIKNWKQRVLDRYDEQQAGTSRPYSMELHTLRLGDIAIATNDFELFTDFGTQMKSRSPALQTFVIQLCGPGSYVPNERAVRGGSYSAIIESNLVGPAGGQVLTEETLKSINAQFKK